MSLVNGTFKMVSMQGMEALISGMKDLGIPEDTLKDWASPDNVVMVTTSFENGVFNSKVCNSKVPSLDYSMMGKIGEEVEIKVPIPTKLTLTQKCPNTFLVDSCSDFGKVKTTYAYNNFGCIAKGVVEGKGLNFTQVFERVEPPVTGYYMFEKEEGIEAFTKAVMPDCEWSTLKKAMQNSSLRVTECGGVWTFDEYLGGGLPHSKSSFKLDEQFRYEFKELNMDYNSVVTCSGPGILTAVSKDNKSGRVIEYTYTFTKAGVCIVGVDKTSNLKSTSYMKRVDDFLGTWRTITASNEEGYFAAAGVPQSAMSEMMGKKVTYNFARVSDDLWSLTSCDPMVPDLTYRLGEEYSYVQPVPGLPGGLSCKAVTTLQPCGGEMTVLKCENKVIVIKSKVTGDFAVMTAEVEGASGSTAKYIMLRC